MTTAVVAMATTTEDLAMTIAVVAMATTTEDLAMTIAVAMAMTTGGMAMIIEAIHLMVDTGQEEILMKPQDLHVRDLPQTGHLTAPMKKRNPTNPILTSLTNRRIKKIKDTFDQLSVKSWFFL
jgi:glutamate 5-kinase